MKISFKITAKELKKHCPRLLKQLPNSTIIRNLEEDDPKEGWENELGRHLDEYKTSLDPKGKWKDFAILITMFNNTFIKKKVIISVVEIKPNYDEKILEIYDIFIDPSYRAGMNLFRAGFVAYLCLAQKLWEGEEIKYLRHVKGSYRHRIEILAKEKFNWKDGNEWPKLEFETALEWMKGVYNPKP